MGGFLLTVNSYYCHSQLDWESLHFVKSKRLMVNGKIRLSADFLIKDYRLEITD